MKKIFGIFMLILIIVGCKNDTTFTPDESYIKFVPKDSSYSIYGPKEWDGRRAVIKNKIMITSPLQDSTDKFQENVIVFTEKYKEVKSVSEIFDSTQKYLPKVLKEYKLLQSGKETINEVDAIWFTFQQKRKDLSKSVAYIFPNKRRGYMVLATSLDSTFSEFENTFRNMARTFKFGKGKN